MKPIIYYAQWPGMSNEDLVMEINQLGRLDSYKKPIFTKHEGWFLLETLLKEEKHEIINATKFINSNGKVYSLEKLLDSLANVEFRK